MIARPCAVEFSNLFLIGFPPRHKDILVMCDCRTFRHRQRLLCAFCGLHIEDYANEYKQQRNKDQKNAMRQIAE